MTPLSSVGGTELSSLTLAKELKKRGHYVYLFCNNGPILDEFRKENIPIILGYPKRSHIKETVKGIYNIRKALSKYNIEIVHSQMAFPVPLIFLASRFLKSRKIKIIWHCRGIHPRNYPIVGRLFNFTTDFVIANCNSERDRLVRNGLSPKKIKTIYNPPNIPIPSECPKKNIALLEELKIAHGTAVVASISRMADEWYGVHYFLEAAAKVARNRSNVKFLVVGDGRLRKKLEKQSFDLGIRDYTIFTGVRRDTKEIYSIIDVLVNPCWEASGTGNINAEAMAFGTPVVASNDGGIPEIVIDGETGFLVPVRNSDAIAERILHFLNNRLVRERMGEAGRQITMRRFTPKRLGQEVEKVYEDLVC